MVLRKTTTFVVFINQLHKKRIMLTSLALTFLLGLVLGYASVRIKLPSLIGMLLTGIILGPILGLIDPLRAISVDLRQLALVIILTRAGLALNLDELKRVGRPAILMCFVPACFELVGITLLAPRLLDVSVLEAAIIGTVVAAVSPAVIVPKMLRLMDEKYGTKQSIPQMIMAGGSVDDVFVIVLFTAFTGLAMGGHISTLSFLQIPSSILLGLAVGITVGYLLVQFFKFYHMRDSVKVVIILSFSFLLMALEHQLKGVVEGTHFAFVSISGLLAVMSMSGAILHNYDVLAVRLSGKFGKLWVAAEILLFVLVGAEVNIDAAISGGIASILLVIGGLLFRMVGVFVCVLGTNLTMKERLFCMIAYLPKATVQAAIGSLPLAWGLECGQKVLTVAVLAILITAPIGAFGIEMTYKKLLTQEE